MLPSLFSVFLDYQCNYACGHCSVGSSPKTKFPMSEPVFERVCAQIETIKSVGTVVFTGGEATLRLDMLKRGLRRARDAGYRTRVVSNVWWAKTPQKARAFLADLVDSGLSELNTSFDDYRLPYTGFDNVVNAVRAAHELDIPMGIGVIREAGAQWDEHRVKRTLADALGVTLEEIPRIVSVIADYPTPSGTGEGIDVSGYDAGERLDMGCLEVVKTVSIHPNGSVKACCGHVMFYSKDLTIGNVMEEDLGAILNRAQRNSLYWWIHMAGPKRILRTLGVEGEYASQCHACQILMTEHRERMIEYLALNQPSVMRDEVLLSDGVKNLWKYVSEQTGRIEGLADGRATARLGPEPGPTVAAL